MKRFVNNKGMTLIEICVSIAILGFIIVAFTGMFTSSFTGIISGGNYSQAEYTAQKAMETVISGDTVAATATITPDTVDPVTVNIIFPGATVSTEGKLEKIQYDDGKYKVELATFVPNP